MINTFSFFTLWIDNLLNLVRFNKKHFLLVVIINACYLFANIIITICDEVVYPELITWTNISTYLIIIFGLALSYLHFYTGLVFYEKFKLKKIRMRNDLNTA